MMDEYGDTTSLSLGIGILSRGPKEESQTPIKLHELFPPRKTERDDDRSSEELAEEQSRSKRKKYLKLTAEQSTVLERYFKEHRTLTPNQKQILSQRLNLLPRQVEVWFQNRRARIKMKQIELNCQLLKNYCRRLSEENKKLRRELQQELRTFSPNSNVNLPPQLCINLSLTTPLLSFCSSCRTKEKTP